MAKLLSREIGGTIVEATPALRSKLPGALVGNGPPVLDGNTCDDLPGSARAPSSTPSAPVLSGTTNSRPAFIRDTGIIHLAASTSISSHRASRAARDQFHAQCGRTRIPDPAVRAQRTRDLSVWERPIVLRSVAVCLRQRGNRPVHRVVRAVVPPELGHLANLMRLDPQRNQLVGPIPYTLLQLNRLLEPRLGGNSLRLPGTALFTMWRPRIAFNDANQLSVCPAGDAAGRSSNTRRLEAQVER